MDILVLPGDDVGPEITEATCSILVAASEIYGLDLSFEQRAVGVAAHRAEGTTLPDAVIEAARGADGVILAPCGSTAYPEDETGWLNVPGMMRKHLDLYANIRPARSRPGVPDSRPGLDSVIVRENTEDFYADRNMFRGMGEFMPTEDVALSVRKITRPASRRIAERAFEQALRRRRHVTVVGKRHVLKMTDGIFYDEVERASKQHPNVTWNEMDVDATAAELYSHPSRFDVIVLPNMFGDILSNLAAAMSGSLGLAAGLNASDDIAAANAGHGSAPDIAGKGIANPAGLMISATMLVGWIGEMRQIPAAGEAVAALNSAIDGAIEDPATRTRDLGGTAGTADFATAVIKRLRKRGA